MDSYSYTSYSITSSSSSSSSSFNSSTNYQQEIKTEKPAPNYRSALHAVRKNVIMKKPIAPMPPTPPKIYKVNPVDFRDVVQKLTGAPADFHPTRLQEAAPPPLSLSPPHRLSTVQYSSVNVPSFPSGGGTAGLETEAQGEKQNWNKSVDQSGFGSLTSPLGFCLSPSSLAWCSSILMSPGTLPSLGPSKVI